MKKFTYSDSVAGVQLTSFKRLSEIIMHIEDFGHNGDSDGIVFQDGYPILIYTSVMDGLTWNTVANNADLAATPKQLVPEKLIGVLNKQYGLNGYITAQIGHFVYEKDNRYIIYLEPQGNGLLKRVTFYKETLKDCVAFYINATTNIVANSGKLGSEWASLMGQDAAFAEYLRANYSNDVINGDEFEAICRGYYK